jgi:outer membrane murein-binding lipoprotein Lpp
MQEHATQLHLQIDQLSAELEETKVSLRGSESRAAQLEEELAGTAMQLSETRRALEDGQVSGGGAKESEINELRSAMTELRSQVANSDEKALAAKAELGKVRLIASPCTGWRP